MSITFHRINACINYFHGIGYLTLNPANGKNNVFLIKYKNPLIQLSILLKPVITEVVMKINGSKLKLFLLKIFLWKKLSRLWCDYLFYR